MESQKGKKEEHGFVHLHFFCIYVAFSICFFSPFYFAFFFAFCLEKNKIKAKKNKSKKQNKCKQNANGQVHFFPIFSPFWLAFFFSLFFPFDFAFVFFGFCWFAFCFFLFLLLSRFFSSFKKVRISYGLVDIKVASCLFITRSFGRNQTGLENLVMMNILLRIGSDLWVSWRIIPSLSDTRPGKRLHSELEKHFFVRSINDFYGWGHFPGR